MQAVEECGPSCAADMAIDDEFCRADCCQVPSEFQSVNDVMCEKCHSEKIVWEEKIALDVDTDSNVHERMEARIIAHLHSIVRQSRRRRRDVMQNRGVALALPTVNKCD